ncbi:hypothetical protein JOC77_003740 [Peribacillus deserti]|uniref:DUF3888 domain-containing protein n=1 Tax=Peribacillus deserti TaxID=673318 RepID=A0ABS2QNI2_9BACI|nr:DUF3888 domain-containing protein [Peribacillus deserti]MBM7694279.1 hypothetical protein [Peribacillus deserti]
MKYILTVFVATVSLLGLGLQTQVFAETKIKIEDKHNEFYDAFLTLLNPYAEKEINKKYPDRSYGLWNAEIKEVKRITNGQGQFPFHFIVKVTYDTYTGPHNPPEGPVTLTFEVKVDGVTVIDSKG